jgi:hypothetical protein
MQELYQLADESGVSLNKLAESRELFELIKTGTKHEALLDWVKRNF